MQSKALLSLVTSMLLATAAQAAEVSTRGGLKITSDDDQFSFQLGGRIMLDAAWYDEDASDLDNDSEVRRARLFAEGVLHGDWGYKAQFDFAGGDVATKDLYIRHLPTRITVGHFKQPFSLEELTSSKYITFMERSLPVELAATSRRLGIGWNTGGDHYTFAVAAYDREADGGEQGPGVGARATWLPWSSDDRLLHLGVAAAVEGPDNDEAGTSRFRARPESHLADRLIDSGTLADVDDVAKLGLEAAWVNGPLSVQSEYITVSAGRDGGNPDFDADGYYVHASYFLTGESRPYKSGAFGRVKPKGKKGAWELGLRFSSLDLNDGGIAGGAEDNITLGVNYYATSHVRFMANLILVDSERAGVSDDPNILQVRGQIDF